MRRNLKILLLVIGVIVILGIVGGAVYWGMGLPVEAADAISGLCYTAFYQPDTRPGTEIEPDQIARDTQLLGECVNAVRTYGCTDNLDAFIAASADQNLQTYATAWISDDSQANEQEIQNLIEQIEKGNVSYAIVGSEALYRGTQPGKLLDYIHRVEEAVKDTGESIPVTTADTVDTWIKNKDALKDLPRVACHIHPVWEGLQPKDALAYVKQEVEKLREAFDCPIDIVECGFPSPGENDSFTQQDVAMFLRDLKEWCAEENIPLFVLGMYDEAWKSEDGSPDFETRWGVFDLNGNLKPGNELAFTAPSVRVVPDGELQERVASLEERVSNLENELALLLSEPEEEPEEPPASSSEESEEIEEEPEEEPEGPATEHILITDIPPYGVNASARLKGRVEGVEEGAYVMVYVFVGGEYYVKPYYASQITGISDDGTFSCETNTGGEDYRATGFKVELYDANGYLIETLEFMRDS